MFKFFIRSNHSSLIMITQLWNSYIGSQVAATGVTAPAAEANNVTDGRTRTKSTSNSTVLHENSSSNNNSPDISHNISASISPVKTSRDNSMHETSSYDQTSSINLKHRIEVVNLDDTECQKSAIKYLLHKVQHNESLMVAVAKEYKNLNEEVCRLYNLNENLVAENSTLVRDLEDLKKTLVKGKETIHNAVESEVSLLKESIDERKNEIKVLESQLSDVFGVLNDEIGIMKSSCRECKDDISEALLSDLKEIKSWFDEQLENLEIPVNVKNVDVSLELKLDQLRDQIIKVEDEIHGLQIDVGESLHRSSQNHIRAENIYVEHSDEIEQIVKKMVHIETEIHKTNQYNRRPNLIIDGIPDRVPQEELEGICLDLIQKLGIRDVTCFEVEGCHRLRKREGDRFAPTIIRFTNRKIPELCKRFRWKLKKVRYNNWFLSFREDLNEANMAIYEQCERLREDNRIERVYTHNGFTKVVLKEGDRPKKLSHMKDLHDLLNR